MMEVLGATPRYERYIRGVFSSFPEWYVSPARISRVTVTSDPDIAKQVAVYSHGTRDIQVAPGIGTLLERCLSHEIGHAVDDGAPSKSTHRFSRAADWMSIHRNAHGFEIPKYRDEPQEYFADMLSKFILSVAGSRTGNSLQHSHPREYQYILQVVVPILKRESSRKV